LRAAPEKEWKSTWRRRRFPGRCAAAGPAIGFVLAAAGRRRSPTCSSTRTFRRTSATSSRSSPTRKAASSGSRDCALLRPAAAVAPPSACSRKWSLRTDRYRPGGGTNPVLLRWIRGQTRSQG